MRGRNPAGLVVVVAAILCGLATQLHAQQSALYGGTLLVGRQAGEKYERDPDMFTLRLVADAPAWWGLRLAGRGDLTALGTLDPSNLDLSTVRTAEGYAAISRPFGSGLTIGPAIVAGGLVPVSDTAEWRFASTWGAGVRLGAGRSWAYVLLGSDGASDLATTEAPPGLRLLVTGSIEWGRVALVGDLATGDGGRVRLGVLVRIPTPGGAQ